MRRMVQLELPSARQWNQPLGMETNALIQVDSKTRKFRYTAEYYAVKHFTHYVIPGSRMINYYPQKEKSCTLWYGKLRQRIM